MIEGLFNLIPFVILVTLTILWIRALVKWDGIRHCDEQCDSCPFPPCRKGGKNDRNHAADR
nr:MAG TPA: FeoB-associated Cys-rich membrane protein [Caudoviricetes sp.]